MSKFRLCQWKFPELSTHGVPGLLNTTRPSLRPRFNKIGAYELKSRIPLRHQSKFRVTNKELSQTTTPSLSQLRHNKFFMAICQAPSCQIARFSLINASASGIFKSCRASFPRYRCSWRAFANAFVRIPFSASPSIKHSRFFPLVTLPSEFFWTRWS